MTADANNNNSRVPVIGKCVRVETQLQIVKATENRACMVDICFKK